MGLVFFRTASLDATVRFYRRSRPSASGLDPEAVHQFFATDPEGRTVEFQTFEH